MKNLLIVTYYFPPSGGPGVQRVLKHVKFLPEFGWNPIVLTVSNGNFPARDESLLEQIPKYIKVYRTKIWEPYSYYRTLTGKKQGTPIDVNVIKKESQKIGFKEILAEFIRGTFFIPDARIGWLFSVGKGIEKIFSENNIDAIYSSSPPYTCSLIARRIKRKTGLPWIAGFRDPWTKFLTTPKRWFIPAILDRRLEKSVFTESDAIECAWEGIKKDALNKYPELPESKYHHISNGFDSDDYPSVDFRKNENFTLTYTGSMYGRRNPASLFEAIEKLISEHKIEKSQFNLKFIGRFGSEVEEMFASASFRDSIEVISYMPHDESIRHLLQSDALLLVVDEAKESEEIVPGKVYEYIGTKKPIIAIAPKDSAIARLIDETNTGRVAHQSEINNISDIFLDYFNQWQSGFWNFSPNDGEINKYERREAAKMLAVLLNKNV